MNDLYLKFPDEATATAALFTPSELEGMAPTPKFQNISIIGMIYKPTGKYTTTEMGPQPVMEAIPGYHVNVRLAGEDAAPLEPYAVTVAQPVRVWA